MRNLVHREGGAQGASQWVWLGGGVPCETAPPPSPLLSSRWGGQQEPLFHGTILHVRAINSFMISFEPP